MNGEGKHTGGPAFPAAVGELGICEGMTLRDYFAAKAMQAFVTLDHMADSQVALQAYEVADAMLKARGQ